MARFRHVSALALTAVSATSHAVAQDRSQWSPAAQSPSTVQTPAKQRSLAFDDRPIALEARFGLATNVGLLGAALEYTPVEPVALGAGIGINPWGPIWGVNVRARPYILAGRDATRAFTVEAALSRGRYTRLDPFGDVFSGMCEGSPSDPGSGCYRPDIVPAEVVWLELEAGSEWRGKSGLTIRASAGLARALSQPDWQCRADGQPSTCERAPMPAKTLLELTFAVGYAL